MAPERRLNSSRNPTQTVLVRRPRRWSAQNRWLLWTRSLTTRYLRLAARRDPLDLVLPSRRSLVRILRERWLVTSQRVRPRIELAIHAILKLSVNQFQRSSFFHTFEPSASVGLETTTFLNTTRFLKGTQSSPRDVSLPAHPSAVETIGPVRAPNKGFEKSPLSDREDVFFQAAAPLTLVFRRMETQTLTHFRVLESLMDRREHSIARRITERSRREETIATTASTVTRQEVVSSQTKAVPTSMTLAPSMKVAPPAVKAPDRWATRVPPSSTVETTSCAKEIKLADLNFDQITDQVVRRLDHRVIALRERMGEI
jgi:hypothetical protein